MQPPITSLKDIIDPTEAMNATLILFAKAFQLTTPTNNNQRTSSNPRNRQIAQPARPRRRDAAYLQTQLLIAQKEEAGIQLQVEELDFMATDVVILPAK
nr:Gag-Pol polyprotein [Tanacetum cinerariifolium]